MFDKRKDNNPTPANDRDRQPEPARQPAVPPKPAPSLIGATVSIEGTLTGEEDILIEGRFNGEVVLLENALVVGKSGDIRADIKAKEVTVHGKANGDIQATDQVEISASGSMLGDILSPRVILQDGAKFKGRIDMEPQGIQKPAKTAPAAKAPPAAPTASKASDGAAAKVKPTDTRARA